MTHMCTHAFIYVQEQVERRVAGRREVLGEKLANVEAAVAIGRRDVLIFVCRTMNR